MMNVPVRAGWRAGDSATYVPVGAGWRVKLESAPPILYCSISWGQAITLLCQEARQPELGSKMR